MTGNARQFAEEKYKEKKENVVSYFLEVFHVVFSGYKDHGLLLRFHHIPEQMKQQRRLVIHTQMEK